MVPAVGHRSRDHAPPLEERSGRKRRGVLAVAAVVLTITWGGILGRRRAWIWILVSAPVGTAVLAGWYVASWLTSTDQSSDAEAGAGVVIPFIPTLIVVGLVLTIGGGIGTLWRVRGRDATMPVPTSRRPA